MISWNEGNLILHFPNGPPRLSICHQRAVHKRKKLDCFEHNHIFCFKLQCASIVVLLCTALWWKSKDAVVHCELCDNTKVLKLPDCETVERFSSQGEPICAPDGDNRDAPCTLRRWTTVTRSSPVRRSRRRSDRPSRTRSTRSRTKSKRSKSSLKDPGCRF